MKRQIIVSSIIATVILGSTIIATSVKAKTPKENTPQLLAENSVISRPNPILNNSKNETVYVITDENGDAKTKFIGSTIYSGTEELPFSFKVTYYLDGAEISANDLKEKSGHVKIVYNYTSTATYNGKYVPFLALTTMTLDHNNFANVRLTNGKIIDEKSDNYIIAGYSITGMNKNLSTDLLPDTFIVEADTTNFKLNDTYTIFTNDILADLDTSKLNRLDEVTNSIYKLEDGINKLVNGATDLSNGLSSALDGTKTLYEGSKTLATGLNDAADGSKTISTILNTITSNNEALQAGANSIITSTIASLASEGVEVNTTNYADIINTTISNLEAMLINIPEGSEPYLIIVNKITELTKAKGLLDLAVGVIGYTNGVAGVSAGASEVSTGLAKLSAGATSLSNGLGDLVEGETKLYQGSVTLKDGLTTFKTSGIDKLINFASKDLTNFTRNLRASVAAADSYKNFGGIDAKTVKFIVKTPSI